MGLVPVFRKLTNLKVIDIAACPLVTGIFLFEVEELACKSTLIRFISSVTGYEQQKIKERLA